jgi:hypothetical protein
MSIRSQLALSFVVHGEVCGHAVFFSISIEDEFGPVAQESLSCFHEVGRILPKRDGMIDSKVLLCAHQGLKSRQVQL